MKDYDFIHCRCEVYYKPDDEKVKELPESHYIWTVVSIDGNAEWGARATENSNIQIYSSYWGKRVLAAHCLKQVSYMTCTDFYALKDEIRKRALGELRNAVEAHGGHYSWWNDDTEEYTHDAPIVLYNDPGSESPCDLKIRSVAINKFGELVGKGVDNGDGYEYDKIKWDDVEPSYIKYIIEAMAVADKIKDVSMPYTSPVLFKDDILTAIQEITVQASMREDMTDFRQHYGTLRDWAVEFLNKHVGMDWTWNSYAECVSQFLDKKIKKFVEWGKI